MNFPTIDSPLIENNQPVAPPLEAFDLADMEDVEAAEIQLKRNGAPLPIYVTLLGPESQKRRSYVFSQQRKIQRQLAKSGKVEFGDPQEREAEETELLVDCVIGWRGVVFNHAELSCTKENVRQLLNDKKRAWFRRAVKEAFEDNEAFIKVSVSA